MPSDAKNVAIWRCTPCAIERTRAFGLVGESDEKMRVPWNRGVLGEREIVSVVDCPVGQVARTQDRARPRVDRVLVASSEENQQGLGEEARQGRLAEIASPGHRRLSRLLSPLVQLHCVLDVNRTLDLVRDRRLVPQRLVLVEVWRVDRNPIDHRDSGSVEQRRNSIAKLRSEEVGSPARGPSPMLGRQRRRELPPQQRRCSARAPRRPHHTSRRPSCQSRRCGSGRDPDFRRRSRPSPPR